jgi:hypothetical protein
MKYDKKAERRGAPLFFAEDRRTPRLREGTE